MGAKIVGMHRILFLQDIRPAGYPANPKAGYRISGRISGLILDLDNYIFGKISSKFFKNSFNNDRLLQTLTKA
jgi:hypothetical protein